MAKMPLRAMVNPPEAKAELLALVAEAKRPPQAEEPKPQPTLYTRRERRSHWM